MIISPNFVRTGTIRCLIYSALLLSIGGYWSYDSWLGWHDGVMTHTFRGGRVFTTRLDEPAWYWISSFHLFGALLTLFLGLRYLLIFALPKAVRNKELAKLAEFNPGKKITVPTRTVVLVVLIFTAIASIPMWR